MKVNELSYKVWAERLAGPGVCLETPPFKSKIHSPLALVSEGLYLLYSEYNLCETDEEIMDFQVSVAPPSFLRRWFRPQVIFSFDGSRPFKPLSQKQALPVFEWGLNWCIVSNAHQYLMIHAACVEKNGKALILPAPPGSGKSTLCAGLVARGWRIFSDEMTLIDTKTGSIVPAPRPISLKNESIEVIQDFAPEMVFGPASDDTHKGRVAHIQPFPDAIANAKDEAEPAIILFPKYEAGASSDLQVFSRALTVIDLAENAFNFNILGSDGFKLLTDTVARCDCYRFSYSELDEAEKIISGLVDHVS